MPSSAPEALRGAYLRLLERRGRKELLRRPQPADVRAFVEAALGTSGKEDVSRLVDTFLQASDPRQAVLDSIAEEVDRAVQAAGLELPGNVYVGLYPTGSVNAQSRSEAEGTLILVNDGLMSLVYETLKINVLSARVADEAPLLERRMVALGLADVFYAYLVRQDPGLARQFPMPKGRRMVILGAIVSPCEKFAVAHEYGHAIAGHLVKDKQVARETPAGNLELIQKSSDQEYEADAIGAKIMVADYDPARERAPYYFDLAARIGGALYLFALDDLLTATGGALTGPRPTIVSDHPPARERAERLRESFLGMGFARSAFDLADAYRLWLTSLGAEVVELVSQRFRAEGPQSQA